MNQIRCQLKSCMSLQKWNAGAGHHSAAKYYLDKYPNILICSYLMTHVYRIEHSKISIIETLSITKSRYYSKYYYIINPNIIWNSSQNNKNLFFGICFRCDFIFFFNSHTVSFYRKYVTSITYLRRKIVSLDLKFLFQINLLCSAYYF